MKFDEFMLLLEERVGLLYEKKGSSPFIKRLQWLRNQKGARPLDIFNLLDLILEPHAYVAHADGNQILFDDIRSINESPDWSDAEAEVKLDEMIDGWLSGGEWYDDRVQIPDRTNFDKYLQWFNKWLKSGDPKQIGTLTKNDGARTIVDWAATVRPDIHKYSPLKAMWHARRWHAAGARKQSEADEIAGAERLEKVADLQDGVAIYQLKPEELGDEGSSMKNCVGKTCSYKEGLRSGKEQIYSVRRGGKRLYTVHVKSDPAWPMARLSQIKAKANRRPGDKSTDVDAAKQAVAWLDSKGVDTMTFDTQQLREPPEEGK